MARSAWQRPEPGRLRVAAVVGARAVLNTRSGAIKATGDVWSWKSFRAPGRSRNARRESRRYERMLEVFAKESNWCTRGLQPDETDLSTDMQVRIMQMSRRGEWTLMRRMGRPIVDFVSDVCIGCGYWVEGCPFDIPRVGRQITSPANARSARIASAWGSCRQA